MTDLIRRKQSGQAWETVVDDGDGGGQPFFGGTSPFGYTAAFQLNVEGGQVDGGTYTLDFRGQVTDPIAWNEGIDTKIMALSNVGDGNFTSGGFTLPGRTLGIWIGDLVAEPIPAGADISIASQALTYLGDPVVLTLTDWETGQAPAEGPAVVAIRAETDSVLGVTMLWVNLGTLQVPDWVPVNGGYAMPLDRHIASSVDSVTDGSRAISVAQNGQIIAEINLSALSTSLYAAVYGGEGEVLASISLSADGISLNLPTANPGAGLLWNDGNTVKVGT